MNQVNLMSLMMLCLMVKMLTLVMSPLCYLLTQIVGKVTVLMLNSLRMMLVDDVTGIVHDESEITDSKDITPLSAPDDLVQPESSQITKLVSEQKADESLTGAFDLARVNKGGYFLKNNLLFRAEILDLAHSPVGCHMDVRRTKERIAMTFTWPTLIIVV